MPKAKHESDEENDPKYKNETSEDEDVQPKKRKNKGENNAKRNKNENGEVYFELGNKKRVTVRAFRGKPLVDIREYYDQNGEQRPGKKGISLNKENFAAFMENLDAVKEALKDI